MDKLSPEQRRQARERVIELQSPICPYCGKAGFDVTTHDDREQKFLGLCGHHWSESDLQEIDPTDRPEVSSGVRGQHPKPNWLGDSWKWIGKRWKWDAILSVGALGMVKLGEYRVAVALLIVAAFAASSKLSQWEGLKEFSGPTKLIRRGGYLLVVVALVLMTLVINKNRGNAPWSNFSSPVVSKNVGAPVPAPVSTMPAITAPAQGTPAPSLRATPGSTHQRENVKAGNPPVQATGLPLLVSMYGPSDPAIAVENPSDSLAEGVTWELVMFRTTDQAFFSYPTQNIGYVKPHSKSSKYALSLSTLPHAPGSGDVTTGQITNGDTFIGCIAVDCPLCTGVTLIVGFTWGINGWFHEVPAGNGKLLLPPTLSSRQVVARYINGVDATVRPEQRKPIE